MHRTPNTNYGLRSQTSNAKKRPESVRVFIRSFMVYISSSAHFPIECGWARAMRATCRAPPQFLSRSPTGYFCSTLAMFSFNETNNKVKLKPAVIHKRDISCFFICPTVDIPGCGYAMYFQDIQTPRLQFKRRDKFGLTRHKHSPLTPKAKIAINKSRKTT